MDQAAITILNFVPIKNLLGLEYKKVLDFPPTRICPNNNEVLLVYPFHPSEAELDDPTYVLDGFYKLISKGLEQ